MTTPEERLEQGRRDAEKRWAPYRAARIAAGLPPTKEQQRGRVPRFIDDPEVEGFWMAELERLGLAKGLDRTALRQAAKRLADTTATDLGSYSPDDSPSGPPEGDDQVIEAYWRGEAARWRRRAERDTAMAARHHAFADEAEHELGSFILKRGGI
jgi:hypothetical protein